MGGTTIWKKPDGDLYELLGRGCYEELLVHSQENQDDLFAKWVEQNTSDLRFSLKFGSAILQDFARKIAGDAKTYAVLKTGTLMGTVECFEHILYEKCQDKQVEKSVGQEVRTVKHLSAVIQALETHGVMTHAELAENLKMHASTLTEAMKKIIDTGTVNATSAGKYKLYSLTGMGVRLGRQIRRKKSENSDIEQAVKIIQEYLKNPEYPEYQKNEIRKNLNASIREERNIPWKENNLGVRGSFDKEHVYDKFMALDANDSNTKNRITMTSMPLKARIEAESNRFEREAC